jgi:hypothetical protein
MNPLIIIFLLVFGVVVYTTYKKAQSSPSGTTIPTFPQPSCQGISTCKSINKKGEREWEVNCKGFTNAKTLHMNSPTEWIWNENPSVKYTTPSEAITDTCPTFPEPTCDGIPTCQTIYKKGEQDWDVDCKGLIDINKLHMNSPTEWMMKSVKYATPSDAITATCTTFPEPSCDGISTCKTIKQLGEQNWEVDCKGWLFKNTLHMNSPSEWIWKYNNITTKHPTPFDAITSACPTFPVPTCPELSACNSINQLNEREWEVGCSWMANKNTLHMNSPSEWVWKQNQYVKYTTPSEAIMDTCPTFIEPSCEGIPACKTITKQGEKDWVVDCDGWSIKPNTLHMNSPLEWIWGQGYNDETFATYKTPFEAISTTCPTFIEPTCGDISSCNSVTKLDNNHWSVACKGWTDPNTLRMDFATDWGWEKGFNPATFSNYKTPLEAISTACPPFIEPSCEGIPSCNSVTKQGEQDWKVDCKGWTTPNTLHKNATTGWMWYHDTTTDYNTAFDAISTACPTFSDPAESCMGMCTSVTKLDEQNWEVACKGLIDTNTLHLNTPTKWIWRYGSDSTVYPTPAQAIASACPTFPEPSCDGISTCVSINKKGEQDWEVYCKGWGGFTNVLHKNAPDRWDWEKEYNPATKATYTTPSEAITMACPVFPEPTCDGISTCKSVTKKGEQVWEIDCTGWEKPNTLHMVSPSEWMWMSQWGLVMPIYSNPFDAMMSACLPSSPPPTTPPPIPVCPESSSCSSVVQKDATNWDIDCQGWKNTLFMNSPSDWWWVNRYNDPTFSNYKTPSEAISSACPVFENPTQTCPQMLNDNISLCNSVSQLGTQDWEIGCQGWTNKNTLHMVSPSEWKWNTKNTSATFASYSKPFDAIYNTCHPNVLCPSESSCTDVSSIPDGWNVSCQNRSPQTLTMDSRNNWLMGTREFTSSSEAIKQSCPPIISTGPVGDACATIPSCIATQETNGWTINCPNKPSDVLVDSSGGNTAVSLPWRFLSKWSAPLPTPLSALQWHCNGISPCTNPSEAMSWECAMYPDRYQ